MCRPKSGDWDPAWANAWFSWDLWSPAAVAGRNTLKTTIGMNLTKDIKDPYIEKYSTIKKISENAKISIAFG